MGILTQIGQLLLSLSILVVLHEMGHFFFARLFKTRVEKFYLFFNPWFSLFKYKKGDTEYGLGWLPLGGYVKISGMIDESMDKEQLNKEPQPYEFRSKPAWQRLLIMLGGVLVNLVLGMFIYSLVLFSWGDQYLPNKNLTDGVWCTDSLAFNLGLQNGDKILEVNNKPINKFSDILPEMIYGQTMTIERAGELITLELPLDFIEKLIDIKGIPILYPRIPFVISQIPDTSINSKSGLSKLDRIVSLNGVEIKYYDQFPLIADSLRNRKVIAEVIRDKEKLSIPVTISDEGKIEVNTGIINYHDLGLLGIYKFESTKYSFLESIPAGYQKALDKLVFYVKQFKLILNPSTGAYKGLGGFGMIGKLFPTQWDWQSFWELTAFLSLILAFMNILPIPALDGGHVMFLLYEIIFRRKPSDKFLEYAQITGMVILFSLLIFANGNDIYRWLTGKF